MALGTQYRVVVFVPAESDVGCIIDAVSEIATLGYGFYDKVAWWSQPGTEQFRPLEGADPTFGKIGEVARVPSVRLEFSLDCDEALLGRVIDEAIKPHHPWEEPVITVYECKKY